MMRTKQVSLIACPSEIISQIVGNLDKSCLNRLAVSSRDLNLIITPYLYQDIELLGHSQKWSRPASTTFRNLAVLLLERPHLAGYVRHFTMRRDNSNDRLREQVEISHFPQALSSAIETASHSEEVERQWLEDMSFTKPINEDALMALLLPALPNLKTLDLTLGEKATYFSRMMQRASRKEKPFDTAPAFEKLSDIMYSQDSRISLYCGGGGEDADSHDNEAEAEEYPCYTVMPLLLPAVSRIFGLQSKFQVGITNQEPWVLPLACGFSSQLSHLELRECLLNSQAVLDLLQVPIALKTFIYEITPKTPDSSILNVNIYRAMEYQMNSLENLWLDCVLWDEELVRFPQFRNAESMPSFANFNNLRILRIASPFLFGDIRRLMREGKGYSDLLARVLPDRLHTLHITRCDHHVKLIQTPLEFLLLRLSITPHLRKIILEHPYSRVLCRSHRISELIELARGKDISLIAGQAGSDDLADYCYDWKRLSMDRCRVLAGTSCRDRVSDAEVDRRRGCGSFVHTMSTRAMLALSTQ